MKIHNVSCNEEGQNNTCIIFGKKTLFLDIKTQHKIEYKSFIGEDYTIHPFPWVVSNNVAKNPIIYSSPYADWLMFNDGFNDRWGEIEHNNLIITRRWRIK
jgi:hypothetical protein